MVQPGKLDKLSKVTIIGAQPVVGLIVKFAITSGLTQMVLVCEVIPQLFEPEVNIVILYVPGVLNVMFKVLVDVPDQTEGLLGKFALKPKFPTTETNELATRFPDAPTVSKPEGPIICQYLL